MDSAASGMIFLGVVVVIFLAVVLIFGFNAQRKADEKKKQQKVIKDIQKKAVSSPPKSPIKDYSNAPKPKQQSVDISSESQSYIEYIFPERLNNKQKLYKTYNRMNIDNVSIEHADSFSYSEPLIFRQKKSGTVSLYCNKTRVGDVSSGGQDMTNQFLSRGDTIAAFVSYMTGEIIKVSYGYYRDYRKKKTKDDMPTEKEVLDFIRENTQLSLTVADKKIYLPLCEDHKSVCFIENNYSICVITTDEPDYNKLIIGEELTIVKEPDNPHDPNAIKITQGNIKLGYFFSYKLQAEVNQYISEGAAIKAYLTQVEPDNQYTKLRMAFVVYK